MIKTLDGHTIEIKGGSYYGPEGVVKQHAGVKQWILIDGDQWYSHDFRNSHILGRYVTHAAELTLAEWIEYCGDEIAPWEPEITIGVDNVRTAEESQDYVKSVPAFKELFDPI
jgi:hypothetical protein